MVSPGCTHCYAQTLAGRFSGPGQPYEGLVRLSGGKPKWTGKIMRVDRHMLDPIRWKKPRRVFVNSMSDFFHEHLPDYYRDEMMAVMAVARHHAFQVLTKRHLEMHRYMTDPATPGRIQGKLDSLRRAYKSVAKLPERSFCWPLPNIWLGVSVELQEYMERAAVLAMTPAVTRFVSAEPLLGPLDFNALTDYRVDGTIGSVRPLFLLDQIIVGGESGPGFRPMDLKWVQSISDQVDEHNHSRVGANTVAFFFKQLAGVKSGMTDGVPPDLMRQEFPEMAETQRYL